MVPPSTNAGKTSYSPWYFMIFPPIYVRFGSPEEAELAVVAMILRIPSEKTPTLCDPIQIP
jgi:hypothetical protein